MEQIISMIGWGPVIVSFVVAYALGWAWYSPMLFYKKWSQGMSKGVMEHPMWMPMSAQAGATLLLSIVINVLMNEDQLVMAILVALTIAGFIKSNGLFAGKTKWAVTVETMYVIVMALLMIGINTWL